MFDTHSHIQFKIFDDIRDRVLEEAKKSGVEKIIAVGTNLESSKKAVEIAQRYQQVFASVGIHPHHVFEHFHSQIDIRDHLKEIENLLKEEKVVAVGETGMDKHEYPNTKYTSYQMHDQFIDLQRELFALQIRLAIKHSKALIIHSRKAAEDTLAVLNQEWSSELEGRSVFHMCEANQDLLDFAIKHNVFISFGGDITYEVAKQNFIKKVPLELLVLETDSPFFTPTNLTSPNTPANLKVILEFIAKYLGKSLDQLEEILTTNSNVLFFS